MTLQLMDARLQLESSTLRAIPSFTAQFQIPK